MKHFKVPVLFLILFLLGCNMTDKYIENHSWKYEEGYHIGDWVEFKNAKFKLKYDTIFNNKTPVAIIISKNKSMFSGNKILLQSLLTNEKGTYHEK